MTDDTKPKVKPFWRIEFTAAGTRRTLITGEKKKRPPKKAPAEKTAPPPDQPKRPRGRPRKQPIVTAVEPTKTDLVYHGWSGAGEKVQRKRSEVQQRNRLRRIGHADGAHIDLFQADWEMRTADLHSRGFEPSTGGGSKKTIQVAKLSAMQRLKECQAYLGRERWHIVICIIIKGMQASEIQKLSGEHHHVVTADIRRALDALQRFYTPSRAQKDVLMLLWAHEAEEIISQAEGEVD